MLSGLDTKIVAVCVEGCEVLCLSCAAKRLGEPRAARVIAGLERSDAWGAPSVECQFSIDEHATQSGYECQCAESEGHTPKPMGEFCERCAEELCHDCGKRLDKWQLAAASSEGGEK
jgi:hypothetical protein